MKAPLPVPSGTADETRKGGRLPKPGKQPGPACPRFTLDGSDSLEVHLRYTCDQVLAGVQSLVSPSKLEALVLGGGYGRGEGGVLKTPSGDRPYNDLEFYVFVRGNRLWNERRYRNRLQHLGEALSSEAGLHVEFKVDSLDRLRQSAITMFSYDLVSGHRLLWPVCPTPDAAGAEPSALSVFTGCDHHRAGERIPLQEATRLLFNRCTGLLLAKDLLRHTELTFEQTDFIGRNLAKAQLALGDAVLTAFGRYHWSCRERRSRLDQLAATGDPAQFAEIGRHHQAGVEFKLHPRQVFESSQKLRSRHREISNLALNLWLWLESRRLKQPLSSAREYAFGLLEKCSGTSRCRNLFLNVKTFGPAILFDRMAAFYPRERLLNSLPLLLWDEPLNDVRVKTHLQNQLRTTEQDWHSFVSVYKTIWPNFS
jgi:hypothetical protein